MENAVDALKQAAAVLIFVVAITVTFMMFSKAKMTADTVTTSQDSQEYLESAELADILYINSESITKGNNEKLTELGDRIVQPDDVISTIYRYNLEKYGVTLVKSDGTVIARFDSNTEAVMRQWYNIASRKDENGTEIKKSDDIKIEFAEKIKDNINDFAKKYCTNEIKLDKTILEDIYEIKVDGNNNITVGAPWYGNDKQIIKRINADVSGEDYKLNKQTYKGKNLNNYLQNATIIIEVINEIDNSDYLKDESGKDTSLLQQYELPTIEIIYIIK